MIGNAGLRVVVGLLIVTAAGGCAGGQFASELDRSAPAMKLASGTQALRLPADGAFSIARAPAQNDPGIGGKADATSHADPQGSATAEVQASDTGKANATFQLGNAFSNESDRQLVLRIKLIFTTAYAINAEPQGTQTAASADLALYARDDRNRLVLNVPLLHAASDAAATSSREQRELTVDVPLGPYRTVSIFLAGKAEVVTKIDQQAAAQVRVEDVSLVVTPEAAPAVPAAGNAQ